MKTKKIKTNKKIFKVETNGVKMHNRGGREYHCCKKGIKEIENIDRIAGKAAIVGTNEYKMFIEKHMESLKKLAKK